jgi:hypothetical protein
MFTCFKTYRGWVALGIASAIAAYLVVWHGAHVATALPFLVIAACPLMHIFMHGGHGHHKGHSASDTAPSTPESDQLPKKGE